MSESKGEAMDADRGSAVTGDPRGTDAGLTPKADGSEFFSKLMPGGLVALMFVDVRGSRSFDFTRTRPFFGENQWKEMQAVRAKHTAFKIGLRGVW